MTKTKQRKEETLKSGRQKLCERSLRFLQKYKDYFGFGDWDINIEDRSDEDSDKIARCAINHHEKKLKVIIYDQFIDPDTDQNNVLIHEFIHARHEIKDKKIKERTFDIEYYEEESMANDITRGFMKAISDLEEEKKKQKAKNERIIRSKLS